MLDLRFLAALRYLACYHLLFVASWVHLENSLQCGIRSCSCVMLLPMCHAGLNYAVVTSQLCCSPNLVFY
jgi:hypothetical protein